MGRSSGVLLSAFLGGAALYLWQKSRQTRTVPLTRDITRWEDEGGAVSTQPKWIGKVADSRELKNGGAASTAATDIAGNPDSSPNAWNFPRS